MLENILVVYLVFVNIAAFGMYGIDKQKAIRKQWRIPEAQLLAVAAIGGGPGGTAFAVPLELFLECNFFIIKSENGNSVWVCR